MRLKPLFLGMGWAAARLSAAPPLAFVAPPVVAEVRLQCAYFHDENSGSDPAAARRQYEGGLDYARAAYAQIGLRLVNAGFVVLKVPALPAHVLDGSEADSKARMTWLKLQFPDLRENTVAVVMVHNLDAKSSAVPASLLASLTGPWGSPTASFATSHADPEVSAIFMEVFAPKKPEDSARAKHYPADTLAHELGRLLLGPARYAEEDAAKDDKGGAFRHEKLSLMGSPRQRQTPAHGAAFEPAAGASRIDFAPMMDGPRFAFSEVEAMFTQSRYVQPAAAATAVDYRWSLRLFVPAQLAKSGVLRGLDFHAGPLVFGPHGEEGAGQKLAIFRADRKAPDQATGKAEPAAEKSDPDPAVPAGPGLKAQADLRRAFLAVASGEKSHATGLPDFVRQMNQAVAELRGAPSAPPGQETTAIDAYVGRKPAAPGPVAEATVSAWLRSCDSTESEEAGLAVCVDIRTPGGFPIGAALAAADDAADSPADAASAYWQAWSIAHQVTLPELDNLLLVEIALPAACGDAVRPGSLLVKAGKSGDTALRTVAATVVARDGSRTLAAVLREADLDGIELLRLEFVTHSPPPPSPKLR